MWARRFRCWPLLLVMLAACDLAPATPQALTPTAAVVAPRPSSIVANGGGLATPISTVAATSRGGAAMPCDDPTFGMLVARFLDAFNRGDQGQLAAFFTEQHADLGISRPGEELLFHWYSASNWYSVSDVGNVYARTRSEALTYFAARHAQHEQLRLRGGEARAGQLVRFTRQADDLPLHDAGAKVEFSCPAGTIVVWSMGPDHLGGTATPR